ncbi:MAG: hypothetical protein K940chlam9_01463 [Chlamydiae bacterium]|nr:hypothetical protein [Chlamydiota bacterium]
MKPKEKLREHWGSRLGFLMATAGSAVGLGSLWKFPYVTGQNGGGLFVLAYLVFTLLIGIPIFLSEMMIGRTAERGPVGAFTSLGGKEKGWRFVGWSCVIVSFLVLSFYAVVSSWALNYSLLSLLNFTRGKNPEQIRQVFENLYQASDINLLWTFLFLALTTGIVYRGIRKGIEFWSKILMPALFLILITLLLYSVTLEGFPEAFRFIFYPNVNKLSPTGLLQALGLACFTLSLGMGIIITYGSYMQKSEDIPKTAVIVAGIAVLVSLLAALMIFPIIFTFNFPPEEGPGLLFKTLPVLFEKLPGSLLLSTIFFLLVVFAALTSTISIMEVLVATITETFGVSRGKGALIVGGIVFVVAIPSAASGSNGIFTHWTEVYGMNFFDTLNDFCFTWLLPINALFIAFFAGWSLSKQVRKDGLLEGSSWAFFYPPWIFLVRWVVPLGILFIILQQSGVV